MGALAVPLPPKVEQAVRRYPRARELSCDIGVRSLKGSNSRWPVDTGRSKRAFRRTGTLGTSRIYNPVSYASFVEARNDQPAKETLRSSQAAMLTAVRKEKLKPTSSPTDVVRQQEHFLNILNAYAKRGTLEANRSLLELYKVQYSKLGRAPKIPKYLRDLDRRIRRIAANAN